MEFSHLRKIREIKEETKEYVGSWGFVDWMHLAGNSSEIKLNEEVLKFLFDESSEARTNPEIFKNIIKEKQIQKYIESFTSKRKDSNDYLQAVNFLKTYFDDSNKKRIDL